VEAPYILYALLIQTLFDFPQQHHKICQFIPDMQQHHKICQFIPDMHDHMMYFFWLAKTSNKTISLTTRLAANPNLLSQDFALQQKIKGKDYTSRDIDTPGALLVRIKGEVDI